MVALYVMAYTAGRGWIEYIRIDTVQMNDVLGLRLNVWTSIVLFVLALAHFVWSSRARPGREEIRLHRRPPPRGRRRGNRAGRREGRARDERVEESRAGSDTRPGDDAEP